jgi:ribosomal-protein-alanine N-acetyltransferase
LVISKSQSDIFKHLPVLETERLRLRKLTMRDSNDVFIYASVPEVAENVSWDYHRNLSDSIHFLRIITQQYEDGIPSPWGIVYKETSRLIGTIGFHVWSPANFFAEVGYALSKEHWNKGLMSEALQTVLDFGFTRMHLNRIEATCKLNNAASEKVMLKCGMKFEGIMRKKLFSKDEFHDLKLYSILKYDTLNIHQ